MVNYLVRFDDVCPTMDWAAWDAMEDLLLRHGIKPMLAVVPDNRDLALRVNPPRADFWDRVRSWQARGWSIGLHGCTHEYITTDAGLVGLNATSEFAGVPRHEQEARLRRALAVFAQQGVRADAWIAPGHSFDQTTIELLLGAGIRTISDGYYPRPVTYLGATWVPQQLWRFRPAPSGVWTVCYHVNGYTSADVDKVGRDFSEYADRITDLQSVLGRSISAATAWDRFFAMSWKNAVRARRALR